MPGHRKKLAKPDPAPSHGSPAGDVAPEPAGPVNDRADAAESKERILQAAVNEFAREGFGGARIDRICAAARSNPRMLYYYYKDKGALYVAVLERVLQALRSEEFKLDVERMAPLDGILNLFEFINRHFRSHPELHQILTGENLLRAQYLRGSHRVRVESSPLIEIIATLLERGERARAFRTGVDPLHLYVLMVSLSYYHRSNAYTLSALFETDLLTPGWQDQHEQYARQMLEAFLTRR